VLCVLKIRPSHPVMVQQVDSSIQTRFHQCDPAPMRTLVNLSVALLYSVLALFRGPALGVGA
jgi:hypothetical protein